jgi:hypothetical protein
LVVEEEEVEVVEVAVWRRRWRIGVGVHRPRFS